MFVYEHISGSSDQCLREVRELCSQVFGPSTLIPLLTVSSDERTREAEKARVSSICVGVKIRNQRVRKLEERSSVRVSTNSKCLSDEIYIRDCDQKDQKKETLVMTATRRKDCSTITCQKKRRCEKGTWRLF